METVRKILNAALIILFIGGIIFLIVLLIGGAFPLNINPSAQSIKFDIARIGWEMNDPANGTFEIVHDKELVKEGFGALQYTYKMPTSGGKYPGLHSTSYNIEGITNLTIYMRSKNPGTWQIQFKRKSDSKIFHRTIDVTDKWTLYKINIYEMKVETGHEGYFTTLDFQPWINMIDITRHGYDKNVVWIDGMLISR